VTLNEQLKRLFHIAACLAISVSTLFASAPVWAQDEDEAPALWELRFAAFGRYAPVYPGSDETDLTLLPIPIPVYRGSVSFIRIES